MRRSTSIATAALVLAAQLLAVVHVASVRHASIPALEDSVCRAHAHPSESLHEGQYVTTHADERCAAVAHLETFARLSTPPAEASVAFISQATSTRAAAREQSPLAPLARAPKSSPPALS